MPTPKPARRQRVLILLATVAVGLGVALVGHHFSGRQLWFLAVPAAVAWVWLFVGTPEDCGGA